VRDGQLVKPVGKRGTVAACGRQGIEQPIERAILAEEEELVLAAKVVIEVPRGEVGGDGDVAHPGGGESARAEDVRRCAQDLNPARIGSPLHAVGAARRIRTTVR
jgi:hypothetical protein